MTSPILSGAKYSPLVRTENYDNSGPPPMSIDNRGRGTSSMPTIEQNPANSARYNPITNPLPHNIQNPYFVKGMQQGTFPSKSNVFAVMANNSLLKN